jgi:hypothetical protein
MTTTNPIPSRRLFAVRSLTIAAALVAAAGTLAGTAAAAGPATARSAAADAGEAGTAEADPVWVQILEQQRIRTVVERMPAGWTATEAMRRQATAPLGDATARARWRDVADRMPAGWPATEVMRRAAQEPVSA